MFASKIALILNVAVLVSFVCASPEEQLEIALQEDDSCANSDQGECSAEFLQRQALARQSDATDAEVELVQKTQDEEAELDGTQQDCYRWRQRRTCTKQRHCEYGHCQTRTHCSSQRYCADLLQEGETAADENDDQDEQTNLAQNEQLEVVVQALTSANGEADESRCYASETMLRACGTPCFGHPGGVNRQNCVTGCLQRKLLAHSCAVCYGKQSDCTMARCLNPCAANSKGQSCTSCVTSKCGGCAHNALLEEEVADATREKAADATREKKLEEADEEVVEDDEGSADSVASTSALGEVEDEDKFGGPHLTDRLQ